MEDLVLDATIQSRMSGSLLQRGKPAVKVTQFPSPPQREAPPLPVKHEYDILENKKRDIARSSSESLRSESPLSSHGHVGLLRGPRSVLQAELRHQQDATTEAKQSIASLRKLALRLAVRISVKEAKIANHAKALNRARMAQYLAQSSTTSLPDYQRQKELFPLSPPLSPGPGKPLPALPRWDSSGRVQSVRFSPYTGGRSDTASSIDEKLSSIDASRASLKEELNATQSKLAQLFESQAVLRERYNSEKTKSRQLDEECQQTHAKIFSLEQSKQQIEDEAKHLHEYVEELEGANNKLRGELKTAKVERHNIRDDLSKLQSSKLTLEHQLQAATGSKDDLENQLQDLSKTSQNVRKELEDKLTVLESESKDSNIAITGLEKEKQKLDEDLRITRFKLSAAVDLEDQLRSQLSTLKDREFNLEHDLELSRDAVAKLEEELLMAYDKLSAMDKSVDELNARLAKAEEAKMDHKKAARLAKASKERIGAHLKKMEKSRDKAHGKLRSTKSDLVLSQKRIAATESEIEVLQGDLARVQQRNDELEALVEKAEVTLSAVVEKTNASVGHIEAIVADAKIFPFKHYFSDVETAETNQTVEQQLLVHQKEIDLLHHTNATLAAKLEAMTEELHGLKSSPGPGARISGSQMTPSTLSSRALSSPVPQPELVAAEKIYEMEMQQLEETRTAFDRVVKSLQTKSAELATIELEHGKEHTPAPIAIPTTPPTPNPEDLLDPNIDLTAKGGEVKSMQPKLVTPDSAPTIQTYFPDSQELGFAKRPRVKSVAADIETMPQIPDIETLPAVPVKWSMPKRPPPTPLNFDYKDMPQISLHKSHSESALKTLNSLSEDRSFWRIGDISTIAGMAEGAPRAHHERRRSISMDENMLRRPKDSPMELNNWPQTPRSPRYSVPPISPRLLRDAAFGYPVGVSPRSSRYGMYAGPLSPDFLKDDPYPFPLRTVTSSESLVASSAALPSPTLNRTSKTLPPRPSHSHHASLPRNIIDKALPPIPRRPVPASRPKAKTTDDIPTLSHKWSLFPRSADSLDIPRPATTAGYYPFNAGPRKMSLQSLRPVFDEPIEVQNVDKNPRLETPEPMETSVAVTKPLTPEPELPTSRTLKLKRSFSLLASRARKHATPTASMTPAEETTSKRGHSFFHRSTKSRVLETWQEPHPAERVLPDSSYSPGSPGFKPANTLSPTSANFPNGISEPVGIYDPASKMWLTPQARKSSHFGVFDPESKAWLAPSPRTDSLHQAAGTALMRTTSNLALENRLSRVSEHDLPGTTNVEEHEDEKEVEEGALSLAEKLEIIRSRPKRMGLAQTRSSSTNTYHTVPESPETPRTTNEKERPWKPGKILGLDRPPSVLVFTFEDGAEKKEMEGEPFAEMGHKSEVATDWEETSKRWKDRFRSVRLLRKPSSLKS